MNEKNHACAKTAHRRDLYYIEFLRGVLLFIRSPDQIIERDVVIICQFNRRP